MNNGKYQSTFVLSKTSFVSFYVIQNISTLSFRRMIDKINEYIFSKHSTSNSHQTGLLEYQKQKMSRDVRRSGSRTRKGINLRDG